ncbi:hypothetical protein [Spirosoma sp. 48-14]|uniref:hypothetical protein n=1 Tax=Spirosoma sp. 48-14 TaxID=1895854 RepID=UPI000962D3BC|nr:hypothetical protein [Spirosoma sp. 48-14]OJW75681.1 MAG: hypothetical protein BGO59_08940 [Spirosoma sp. 48-14]
MEKKVTSLPFASDEYKQLRLQVMMSINNPDEYYRTAAKSLGLDTSLMQHDEVATFKALLNCTEADIIIATAYEQDRYEFSDQVKEGLYAHLSAIAEGK